MGVRLGWHIVASAVTKFRDMYGRVVMWTRVPDTRLSMSAPPPCVPRTKTAPITRPKKLMLFNGRDIVLSALHLLGDTHILDSRAQFIVSVYAAMPQNERLDLFVHMVSVFGASLALSFYALVSSHSAPFDEEVHKYMDSVLAGTLMRGGIRFQSLPPSLTTTRKVRTWVYSTIQHVLRAPDVVQLYLSVLGEQLDEYLQSLVDTHIARAVLGQCPIDGCTEPWEEEDIAFIAAALHPKDLPFLLMTWYYGSRQAMLPSSLSDCFRCILERSAGLLLSGVCICGDYRRASSDRILVRLVITSLSTEKIPTNNPCDCQYRGLILSLLSIFGKASSDHYAKQGPSGLSIQHIETMHLVIRTLADILTICTSIEADIIVATLKVILPLLNIDPHFTTALSMLLASMESTDVHIVVSNFLQHGSHLFHSSSTLIGTGQDSYQPSIQILLVRCLFHRALIISPPTTVHFYMSVLPLMNMGLLDNFETQRNFLSLNFICHPLLPVTSATLGFRFLRSSDAYCNLAEDCVGETDTYLDVGTFLNNVAQLHHNLAQQCTNCRSDFPATTDALVYGFSLQVIIQSLLQSRQADDFLTNICTLLSQTKLLHSCHALSIVTASVMSTTKEYINISSHDTITDMQLSSHAIHSLSTAFDSFCEAVTALEKTDVPLLLASAFDLAFLLSSIFFLRPSTLMLRLLCCTFQSRITCDTSCLDRWIASIASETMQPTDTLAVLLLCALLQVPFPTVIKGCSSMYCKDEPLLLFLGSVKSPAMGSVLEAFPSYFSMLTELLEDSSVQGSAEYQPIIKACITVLRHAYSVTALSPLAQILHARLWASILPQQLFLSPVYEGHIPSLAHSIVSSVNALSVEALANRFRQVDSLQSCGEEYISKLLADWATFDDSLYAPLFALFTSIASALARHICSMVKDSQATRDSNRIKTHVIQICDIFHGVLQVYMNRPADKMQGHYLQLGAELVFTESVVEALWCLYPSHLDQFTALITVIREIFVVLYQWVAIFPAYSYVTTLPLIHSLHVLIFNREKALLRTYFIRATLLDFVLCWALFISSTELSDYTAADSCASIQLGYTKKLEDVLPYAEAHERFVFPEYRTRRLAVWFIQLLLSQISPYSLMKSLLSCNAQQDQRTHVIPTPRKIVVIGNSSFDQCPVEVTGAAETNILYIRLIAPLLEPHTAECSQCSTHHQRQQLALLYILRLAASLAYHNETPTETAKEIIQHLIAICKKYLAADHWTHQTRTVWYQIIVLLLLSDKNAMHALRNAFPPIVVTTPFKEGGHPENLTSYLAIVGTTICISIEDWLEKVPEQLKSGVDAGDHQLYVYPELKILQIYLRSVVPCTFSHSNSVRRLAQSLFIAIQSQGKRLTDTLKLGNIFQISCIDKALLGINISSFTIQIFKASLEVESDNEASNPDNYTFMPLAAALSLRQEAFYLSINTAYRGC